MSKKFTEYKGLDLPGLAAEVLGKWDADDTFHKSITTREGHPTFVFYEGPPSANGMPGIHHVMARTIKDVFCRYKTSRVTSFTVRQVGILTVCPLSWVSRRSWVSPRRISAARSPSRSITPLAARP